MIAHCCVVQIDQQLPAAKYIIIMHSLEDEITLISGRPPD